ncbi:MAG TPA: serine hydroxymethyltransferase [Thermoplasmata archaeon]|jgi:glycine hydroxymethyltransferase|nr:serine hydroxymethyltransferase [Thermoplasmata archaeon]
MNEDVAFLQEQVDRHHAWFSESLPMIASENLISPLAREMLLTDFQDRYAEGLPGERYYQGNTYVDQVEVRVADLAKRLFRCRHADIRPISGTNANTAVLFALGEPGHIVSTVALSDGAHISTAKFGAVGVRGMKQVTYPFDAERMNLDVDGTIKVLKSVRPEIALFGQSVFLFPTPLKELRDTLHEIGCYVWYDGAHVLGLIAGGKFQDPFREGAEVLTGSTHKTLPGPQHGILLAEPRDEKMEKKLLRGVFPGVVSNHHLHAMAALGITLAEHLEFGRAYAEQVVRNAKALAQALHTRGIRILAEKHGFTESHIVAADVKAHGGGAKAALDLERANIIANKNLLPTDTSPVHPSGVRFGSQELTRIGMREGQMDEVAELVARVVVRGHDPKAVAPEVAALRKDFMTIQYCFGAGAPAHARARMVYPGG